MYIVIDMGPKDPDELRDGRTTYWPVRAYLFADAKSAQDLQRTLRKDEGKKTCFLEPGDLYRQEVEY